ncbi:MAG: ABC transporter permease subunit [Ruminococcaceae bacterium]|nr:ABC transporter permease subunit [Oscillospiraceae bacterium]
MKTLKLPKWSFALLSLCFWIGLWWVVATIFQKPLLLPTPPQTLKALLALAVTSEFYLTVLLSLARITLGILLALVGGTLLALLTTKSMLCHHLFSPLLSLFKATPVASVIFLILLWVGRDNVPLWIAFMMALPIVWSNVCEGLLQTDKQLLEMAALFQVPKWRVMRQIRLPSLAPYFLSACRSAIALSWKAGIAAEVLCVPESSIGRAIYEGKTYLMTEELFAWTFVVIVISVLIEKAALSLLEKAQKTISSQKEVRGSD